MRRFSLALATLLAACAHLAPAPAGVPAPSTGRLAERRALGPLTDFRVPASEQGGRLLRIAQLEAGRGDDVAASTAMQQAFLASLSFDRFALSFLDPAEAKAARSSLEGVTGACVKLARELEDAQLLITCARGPALVDPEALRWARTQRPYAAASEERWLRQLLGEATAAQDQQEVPASELAKQGRPGIEALHTRLMQSPLTLRSAQEAANALLESDKFHVLALIWRELARDVADGKLALTAELTQDLAKPYPSVELLRVQRESKRQGRATSLKLWLASRYLKVQLVGDAVVLAEELAAASELSKEHREIAALIATLARASAGEGGSLLSKLKEREAAGSAYLWNHLASLGDRHAIEAEADAAKRHIFERDLPRFNWLSMDELAADPALSKELRLKAVAESPRTYRTLLRHCVERSLSRSECSTKLEAASYLDEYEAGWAELLALEPDEIHADWLTQLGPEADDPEAVDAFMAKAAGTRLGQTGPYLRLALVLSQAKGDGARTQELLEEVKPYLTIQERIGLALAGIDRKEGRAVELSGVLWGIDLLTPVNEIEAPDAEIPEWLAAPSETPSLTASFMHGVRLRNAGYVHQSLDLTLPLLERLEGDEGALLAYYVVDTATYAENRKAEQRAEQRLKGLAQGTALMQRVRGTTGVEACRSALSLPDQAPHRAVCVASLAENDATHASEWLALEAAFEPSSALGALQRNGVSLTRKELLAFLRGPPAAALDRLDDTRIGRACGDEDMADALFYQLRDPGITPETALKRAQRLWPLLQGCGQEGTEAAWLGWFAGQGEQAERLAEKAEGRDRFVTPMLLRGAALRKILPTSAAYRVLSVLAFGRPAERHDLARELAKLPKALPIEELRCELLDEDGGQYAACARAWELGSRDANVLTIFARATSELEAEKRDAATARLLEEAKVRFGSELPAQVWHLEAEALARAGKPLEAARAEEEAFLRGLTLSDETTDLAQARHRPLVSRLAVGRAHWGASRFLALARSALHEGNLDVGAVYVRAAEALGEEQLDLEQRAQFGNTKDMLELARRDRTARQLDAAGLADLMTAFSANDQGAAMERVRKRFPRSALVRLLQAEQLPAAGQFERALSQTKEVARSQSDLGLVAVDLSRLLTMRGHYAEAREVLARSVALHPNDPRLEDIKVPSGPDELRSAVIADLGSSEGLLRALRAVSEAELDALDPKLASDVETGAELALPAGYEPSSRFKLGGQRTGLTVGIKVLARASRCEPALCLAPLNQQYEQLGLSIVWSSTTSLPQGQAALSLARGPENLILTVAVPIGERVYAVFATGSEAQLTQRAAELALALRTFRPLDSVLGARPAMALRDDGQKSAPKPDDHARLHARMAALRSGKGCPLKDTLAGVRDDDSKAWLLLDVYLSTPTEQGRKAVVSCATTPAQRARLGLVSLWDESPALHDQGIAFIRADASAAVAQLRRILPVLDERALSAASEKTEELPPHGVAELLAAMHGPARQALTLELLGHTSERVRVAALAALSLDLDAPLSDGLLARAKAATPGELYMWLDAAGSDPRILAMARERIDALLPKLTPSDFFVVTQLVAYLAAQLDPADSARFAQAVARVAAVEGSGRKNSASDWLRGTVRKHTVALGGPLVAEDEAPLVLEASAAQMRAQAAPAGSAARIKKVLSSSLADVLPGAGWSYFRVQKPATLLSELKALYARLGAADNAQRPVALAMLSAMLEEAGSTLLSESQGLDLERPIECAAPVFQPNMFVCSGYVRDRDALRRELGRRPSGQDDGVALLTHVAKAAASATDSVERVPGLLHDMYFGSKGTAPEVPSTSVERVRSQVQIGGAELEQMTIVDLNKGGGISRDVELSLFGQDRWLVFAGNDLARWLLSNEASAPLAQNAEFRKAMQGLNSQSGVQAFLRSDTEALPVALEIGTTAQGLRARVLTTRKAPAADLTLLSRALPEGAVSEYATPEPKRILPALQSLKPHRDAGSLPPTWLFSNAEALAFGWYPKQGDALWAHWVGVAQMPVASSPEPLRNLTAGTTRPWQGLYVARVDDRLVVATGEPLLRSALEQAERPLSKPEAPRLQHGKVDAARVGQLITHLSTKRGVVGQNAIGIRGIAALASVAGDLRYATTRKGDLETIELELRPELSSAGTTAESINKRAGLGERNAIKVPQNVPEGWLEHGIVLTLSSSGSEGALLRAFPDSSRLEAKAVAGGAVELRVVAGAGPADTIPKSSRPPLQMLALLSADDEVRPNDPPIRELAQKLGANARDVKARVSNVVNWVQNNIRYELQPSSADATRILAQRRGDCSEFAVLTVSLLRSLGIASEVRSGLALSEGELVAHAWVAYYDGEGFREIDPTAGSLSVHAGYVEASVLDITALLSLAEIKVVDVKPLP